MSEIVESAEVEAAPNEDVRPMLLRVHAADVEVSGKREIEGYVFPYEKSAWVADPPLFRPYQEAFARGCVAKQLKAPNRVYLDFEHYGTTPENEGPLSNVLGHGISLDESGPGLLARFKVRETPDGDAALDLARSGSLGGFSAVFKSLQHQRVAGGIIKRTKIKLARVSLCREPAYPDAVVTAVRSAQEEIAEAGAKALIEAIGAPSFDSSLAQRLGDFVSVPPELRLLARAFTEQTWDGSASRWATAADYCDACVIDDNPPGAEKTKALCHLPIREPDSGDVNVNAVRNALGRLPQVASSAAKKEAARQRLERLLAQFNAQG